MFLEDCRGVCEREKFTIWHVFGDCGSVSFLMYGCGMIDVAAQYKWKIVKMCY